MYWSLRSCALRLTVFNMYESFYGLKESPFNMTPDPQFLYLGENHREALAQLVYGVKEKKGFIVLTGEVGTGKTTLVHYLLDKLDGIDQTKTAFLFNPKLSVHDFFEYILKDLGMDGHGSTKADYLHTFQQNLLQAYENGKRVILFIDEAQGLNAELLEEIRLLSNLETSKSKLLQIVLVGQPELNKTLLQPEFRQLKQRVNLRYHLRPLSERETKEYINKRLKVAGAMKRIFTRKAIKEVYRRSGGIPRLINILCDNSLLSGYALERKNIDKNIVKEAARDLQLEGKTISNWSWLLSIIFITVGFLLFVFLREHMWTFFGVFLEYVQLFRDFLSNEVQIFLK